MLLCLLEMDSHSVEVFTHSFNLLLLGLVGKEQIMMVSSWQGSIRINRVHQMNG